MRPKIKSYHKGWIGHDGNGMVGGKWANTTILAYKDIPVKKLTDGISDEEKAEKCLSWLTEKIGKTFRVEAYFDCGYDHSVGLSEYCEMNESFDPEQIVFDSIKSCSLMDEEDKARMMFDLANICEDEDGYELYEIDYPEE